MFQLLEKKQQAQARLFGGRFVVNKPVASGFTPATAPFSNLFYWSHAVALDDCEFDLHPHEGFEIMTFILEGRVSHYDTASQAWTPLQTGDFQVIQSGRGLQHAEKISQGTRSFQLWFDPDFRRALQTAPAYVDYHAADFVPTLENGLLIRTFLGPGSPARAQTEGLAIRQIEGPAHATATLPLHAQSAYTCYVLAGAVRIGGHAATADDAVKISAETAVEVVFDQPGQLFIIETPLLPAYPVAWRS